MEKQEGEWEEVVGSQGIWLPTNKGDSIQGTVQELKQETYGVQAIIKGDNDLLIKTPSHKALQGRLSNVQIGDYIKIEYLGEELPKVKGQKGVRLYKVSIKRVKEETVE